MTPDWISPSPIDIPENLQKGGKLARTRLESFTWPIVAFGGFCDGINPCAIGTLVFFMSLLALSGIRGRNVVLMGVAFCLASFVTYAAIGYGLLRALHLLTGFEWVRFGVETLMMFVLGVFAYLSFRDAWRFKISGKPDDVTLQLPDSIKTKIHTIMRKGLRFEDRGRRSEGVMAVWGFVIGAAVTALESVCTGQVYLPTMIVVIKSGEGDFSRAWTYLLLYNLMFIVPLVVVFALTCFGLKTHTLLDWSKKNVVFSKVLLGLFCLVMALLIVVL